MDKGDFLSLMRFPMQWLDWDMYPDELFEGQVGRYSPGDEDGAEHDRNEAFHWWRKRQLSQDQYKKLSQLTYLDPDKGLGADVRTYLERAKPANP